MGISYVDCDGVLIDSDDRLKMMKESCGFSEHSKRSYYEFFKYLEEHPEVWEYVINDSNEINHSIDIIKELENLKKIVILTKVHSLYEMDLKVRLLKDKYKIKSDILFVPPYIDKNEIVDPRGNILVDDSRENVDKWIASGGVGYLFDKNSNDSNHVNSLNILRRK